MGSTDQRDALKRFVALAQEGQRMKQDELFQVSEGAVEAIVALNVEMNQLRQVLRNAGYSIPLTNDLATEDIEALKSTHTATPTEADGNDVDEVVEHVQQMQKTYGFQNDADSVRGVVEESASLLSLELSEDAIVAACDRLVSPSEDAWHPSL